MSKRAALFAALGGVAVVLAPLALTGCTQDAFCFGCSNSGHPGSHTDGGGSGDHDGGVIVFKPPPNDGGNVLFGGDGSSACESVTDISKDPQNCGACGNVCERTNAIATCNNGQCAYACAPNFYDLGGDLSSPGGGCNYLCQKSSDTETCNGLDDDCNGLIDEALVNGKLVEGRACTDANNCGLFGKACVYTSAAGACVDGQCVEGACATGFFPDPTQALPNCAYACKETNGGVEICDGRDNDCNGKIDDNANVSSDPLNCGACGNTCISAFPNSEPACQNGSCVLGACYPGYFSDPTAATVPNCMATCKSLCNFPFALGICASDGTCSMGTCLAGHYDLNGDPKDGCEYSCEPTGLPTGTCNNLDNACTGTVNDGVDLTTDAKNCGECGNSCDQYFPGASTACVASKCKFVGCLPGYVALNGSGATGGCQYQCSVTNGGKEVCDGIDNDCDGVVDNNLTDTGGSCTTTKPGACAAGTLACASAALVCVSSKPPSQEVCNGLDDDCNGKVDDGPGGTSATLPGVGFKCGQKQVGICQFGTTACGTKPDKTIGIVCQGEIDPANETCNGQDDDCDGVVDNHLTDSWVVTTTACDKNPAPCKAGTYQCLDGAQTCIGAIVPSQEICDGTGPGTGSNPSCTGTPGTGCVWPSGAPTRLDTLNNATQGTSSNNQLVSTSTGNEYFVAYAGIRAGNPSTNNSASNVFFRASQDAGATWGAAEVDATGPSLAESEPNLFARAGHAYMVFSRFANNNGTGNRRIFFREAAATDTTPYTGFSAGTGTVAVRVQSNGGIDCFGAQGVVAKSDGTTGAAGDWLAVVWTEIGGSPTAIQRNVFLAYSKDGGTTWSTAGQVNTGTGANKGQSPVLATDGNGLVYLAWRDSRNAGLQQVYFSTSSLASVTGTAAPTFSTAVPLQPITGSTGSSSELTMVASGTSVDVAWTDFRTKFSTIRVASSTNSGQAFTQINGVNDGQIVDPDGTNNNASAADLAIAGKDVVVVWQDKRSGNPNIRANHSGNSGGTWLSATPRVDTGTVNGAYSSVAPSVAFGSAKVAVDGTPTKSVYVAWQDFRYPASAVLANVSLDSGVTWAPDASVAYRMDVDTTPPTPAAGSAADSQSPNVLATSAQNSMAVVWLDFRTATGANGINGDIWTRRSQ
jgi:hypothetical protein